MRKLYGIYNTIYMRKPIIAYRIMSNPYFCSLTAVYELSLSTDDINVLSVKLLFSLQMYYEIVKWFRIYFLGISRYQFDQWTGVI